VKPFATRKLGKSGLDVSILGFGGVPIGDFWAKLSDETAVATVKRAAEAGLSLYDTSPLYGHGLSEHRIGQVLRQRQRSSFVLSTKVGRILEPMDEAKIDRGWFAGGLNFEARYDYSYDGSMRSLEHSLHRLGMNRVDVLLIHDIDVWTHGSNYKTRLKEVMSGCYPALEKLRSSGVVRAIGIGVNENAPAVYFARETDIDCILLAGRYTLLEHAALDELLPLCTKKNIGIMLGGPYNSGILATGAVPGATYNYKPAPQNILDRVAKIEAVCGRHGLPIAAAALQFPLGHPNVSSMIPGAAKPEEVDRNIALMQTAIPAAFWDELKEEGLMPGNAPVPHVNSNLQAKSP
jgi:D-threo-aldose 1-dehydrogenase